MNHPPLQPGVEIHFTPPWKSPPETALAAALPNDKSAVIIMSEDNPVSRELTSAIVNKWGFRNIVTRDGHEAMAAIRAAEGPVVVILDWMMPSMDGLEVCRRVRQMGKLAHIILLTARAATESLVEGLESGADDYLVKPFNKDELLARIHVGIRILNLEQALQGRVLELEDALLQINNLNARLQLPL